jgi:hypothetical protein
MQDQPRPLANTSYIADKALQIAIGYLGQEEQPRGSNSGTFVQACLKSVGIGFPAAWCQAFVYKCYEEAIKGLEQEEANPVVRTGGVLKCWNETKFRKLTYKEIFHYPELIKPGDQIIMDFGKGRGHTGIVEWVEGFIVHTIEGNTNDEGSREGYEVARMKRHVSKLKGVISYNS